jgi:hypothetical protein
MVTERKVIAKWLCFNCGSLSDTEQEAKDCCAPDEVYLCGRRNRFHFDEDDATRCSDSDKPTGECTIHHQ